jgi:transcription antitermination factor NusG
MDELITTQSSLLPIVSPKDTSDAFWYAACTASRHEKSVAEHLRQRDVECFLPLYETIHRWNNGRHRVQLPLFPGYIFVRMALRDKLRVLQVPGLAHLVSFSGVPAVLPRTEIESLRNALKSGVMAEPHNYLTVGSRVEIRRGPLQGMQGILLRHQAQYRVVISVEMIMQSIAVEVAAEDVVALERDRIQPTSASVSTAGLAAVCA